MAISETNQLKNNNDLTQHFLYSYSSYSKLGPNEKRRCEFNEDLIFDRSRKSIFTQSQEFGYISDTVYTLSVGNQINDGNSYLTLRSYEGNIEFYNYTPLKIIDINWDTIMGDSGIAKQIDGTYLCYNQKFKSNYVEIKYIGSAIPSTCKLTFNDESTTLTSFEHEAHTNYKQIRVSSPNFNSYFNLGKNTLTVEIGGTYFAYHNVVEDMQHDSFSRFQLKPQVSSDTYSKSFNAYNPIKIIKTKTTGSYWDVDNNPADYLDITSDGDVRLTDDYYREFHDDHHICENEIDEILALAIPERLENRNKIYGFVGGTSTEFYKTKNSSLSYCGENYNLYFGTGNNWNGLDLWFQKKNFEENDINHGNGSEDIPTLENYDCYIEVACRNNGIITLWVGSNPTEMINWNVIANQKTRIPINKNKINDPPGYIDHLIQSGGSDVGLFYVDLSGLGNYKIVNGDYLFQTASSLNIVIFGDIEFDTVNGSCAFAFQGCNNISDITCKQSVKDFLQSKAVQAYLPQKFRIGGVGAWHII